MIKEVAGDILLTKAQAIAHGIAPNDHFNSGLALSLREQWPAMYQDFRHYCHATHPKPGTAWIWSGAGGQRMYAIPSLRLVVVRQYPRLFERRFGRRGAERFSDVEFLLRLLDR